jgi:hypothetical protein
VQVAESVAGRRRIVAHVGSARTEAELGLLLGRARALLVPTAQGELDLWVVPAPRQTRLVDPAPADGLFAVGQDRPVNRPRVRAPQVLATSSRLLFDLLAEVYATIGFTALGGDTFRDLVIARVVEPTSILTPAGCCTTWGCARPARRRCAAPSPAAGARRPRPDRQRLLRPCPGQRGSVAVPVRRDHPTSRPSTRTRCAKSATPRNAGSTRRSWSGCWSTDTAFRWGIP